jgi:hypothetical protein
VLAGVVVGAPLPTVSDQLHQLPEGGMAASPEIPAISSSLAPQAAAISKRDSVSSEEEKASEMR